jgi:hypothetical protein
LAGSRSDTETLRRSAKRNCRLGHAVSGQDFVIQRNRAIAACRAAGCDRWVEVYPEHSVEPPCSSGVTSIPGLVEEPGSGPSTRFSVANRPPHF